MFAHSFFGKWAVELFCADDVENVATTKHFVFMGTKSVHFEFCRRQLSSNRCFNTDSFSFVREKNHFIFFHFSMNKTNLFEICMIHFGLLLLKYHIESDILSDGSHCRVSNDQFLFTLVTQNLWFIHFR